VVVKAIIEQPFSVDPCLAGKDAVKTLTEVCGRAYTFKLSAFPKITVVT